MSTRSRTARPSVGLVMIVRNEEVTLPRLAASVRSQVDHYTIVDTGSTDATVEVARRAFGEVPGDIVVDEWRGFAGSRNVALEAAAPKTDWLLLMDADETLVGRLDRSLLRPDLDALELRRRSGSVRLWLPRLVRSGPPWRGLVARMSTCASAKGCPACHAPARPR